MQYRILVDVTNVRFRWTDGEVRRFGFHQMLWVDAHDMGEARGRVSEEVVRRLRHDPAFAGDASDVRIDVEEIEVEQEVHVDLDATGMVLYHLGE